MYQVLKDFVGPIFSQYLTSENKLKISRYVLGLRRQVTQKRPKVILFIDPNDPYSYLLLQILNKYPKLTTQLDLCFRVIGLGVHSKRNKSKKYQLYHRYSLIDANRVANFYHLDFPKNHWPIGSERYEEALIILLGLQDSSEFLKLGQNVLDDFWRGRMSFWGNGIVKSGLQKQLLNKMNKNIEELHKLGQDQAGMLYCEGEFYWGPDRIHYLWERFGLGRPNEFFQIDQVRVPILPTPQITNMALELKNNIELQPIKFFFSFRSPFSYLAIERLRELQHKYMIKIEYYPVLPMVMRGIDLTQGKKWSLLADASREAKRWAIPFGKICDPLGDGIMNAYKLFPFAREEDKLDCFVHAVYESIFVNGKSLRKKKTWHGILNKAKLDVTRAMDILDSKGFEGKELARKNGKLLRELGLWGVPSYTWNHNIYWGQDRIPYLEEDLIQYILNYKVCKK